ncbi:23S rRNA m(2)A-2503 methyltransferase [Sporobacter termitidis DSM 10068]|uniref:Probable dual-specificity RNA methyltransferase RlmN n=1 Tax=Sporobacter termitidis DSM 10068 TaxID=1123282 RepID=A0A1M5THG9_9FIRM|nr:23S rRNA (adenine(2503)-C(2))-methyltransferase RlmN [Sporobacter termitidis]SHH50118.1 23S rRNA m(2)A-2503 methyltransferase [Sporobacter termitidis DSM 10068]
MKEDIKSYLPGELREALNDMGEPAYRAEQVFKWLHRGVKSFSEMTDLSKALREKLGDRFFITVPEVVRKQVSAEDGTVKYLWRLYDGNTVESVVMRYHHGSTVCISSQVGCRMGCRFCASTIGGLVRNLMPSELLDQVLFSQLDSGEKISNIVLMGIGEPLDNYDNVLRFLKLVSDPLGVNIGVRHISVSTCGLVEKVDKLGEDKLQFTLSVSLHAPDDDTRSRLMPVNKSYGVDRLLKACRAYFDKTGRRISFEYAMIDGVNDTPRHARLLADKLKNTGSHVNLIPLNDVTESALHPSTRENLKTFIQILQQRGINVTVRRKLGGDIDASCGQLRRKTV